MRTVTTRFAVSLLLAAAAPVAAPAQSSDAPLVTDRPDITESAYVVPRGSIQLETGVARSTVEVGPADVDVTTLFGTLVRWGLTDRVELRTGFDGLIDVDVDGLGSDDGSGDTSLGVKVALRDDADGGPAIAVILASSLPTGERGFGAEKAEPALLTSFAFGLSERVGLGTNLGIQGVTEIDPAGGEHLRGQALASVSLGVSLAERIGAFVETAAVWPIARGGSPTTVADAGLTFAVRDRLQLDLSVGTGLSDDADGEFFGVGLSYRWDRD